MGHMMNLGLIRSYLRDDEILAQMAEEAAELSQACLKLRRAIRQDNPTPVPQENAINDLAEEWADVALCMSLLGKKYIPDPELVQRSISYKAQRWADRLQGISPPASGGGET